jgi:hypothetical protein
MKTRLCVCCAVALLAAQLAVAAEPEAGTSQQSLNLRRAVPGDVYLAVYAKHNPERDFQRKYYEDVWKTVQETQIIERVVKIATARMSKEDVEKAKSVLQEVRQAAAPIDVQALLDASEAVYAQSMQVPSVQHLFLVRLGPKAAGWEEGIKNLFALAQKYSEGEIQVQAAKEGDVTITTLSFPPGVPFRPSVARIDGVLLLASSDEIARRSLGMLLSGKGESKFDDPRLKEALGRLPEPEDGLVFYDGKLQFAQLRQLGNFIRGVAGGNPEAQQAAGLMEQIFDALAILDYEVTVNYTEGNQNRTEAYGKLLPGAENKLLGKVALTGRPFRRWQRWVPAEALSFSLSTGANLHPVYEWVMGVIKERFPAAQGALEQFARWQSDHDVYLDRDILQAFSGEFVSVALPAASPSLLGGQDTVIALRCRKPERIRELLHRLVDWLKQKPIAQGQQLTLAPCEKLKGFEEVSAVLLSAFGAKPVIGFRGGWMFVGSNAPAVEKVLETRAGRGKTFADTEAFKRLGFNVEGPVDAISYTNLAESTRNIAKLLDQAGAVATLVLGIAGAQADAEALKPVQEILGLLPSVAKIVAKFDFLEAEISATQRGDEPGTYVRRTAILVRPKSSN